MKAGTTLLLCLLLSACGGGAGSAASGSQNNAGAVADNPAPAASVPASAPVTPPVAPPVAPPVVAVPGWTLVWSDEFDVDGLPDAAKWDYDTERNKVGWYNNEKQYYARARAENAKVLGGKLIITARKETLNPVVFTDYGNQQYTSARLLTRGRPGASWTYGLIEVRAKLPCSLGTWPAIWTLGTGGVWPDDGEIDLMEQRGGSLADKAVVLGTVHTRAYNYYNGTLGVGQGSSTVVTDACSNFHTYQLTWSADKLQLGVDGNNYFEFLNPKDGNYTKWPFDRPQYLILNLAMGGDLGGAIPLNFVSDQMEVDYVRVYQK